MKILKKLIAAALAGCLVFSLCACHGKDETAVTIDGKNITTALYINALLEADSAARSAVDAKNEDSTEEIDYYSQTMDDGSNFVDYVKTEALNTCKEYVFYMNLVENGTIKLDETELSEAENYANSYWSYYGLSYLYEPNGVSYDTYEKAFIYSYYANEYFEYLYGEGGEKEVSQETIKEEMVDKYILVYTLSATYDSDTTDEADATDAEIDAITDKFNAYADRLKKGEEFKNIYNEYNGVTEEEETTTETTEDGPKDQYATIITEDDSDDFDEVFDLKKGEVLVAENADKTGINLYVKLDITEDEYYLDYLKSTILSDLKSEEFETYVNDKVADYTVEENSWATGRIKVEELDYSQYEALMSSASSY